MEKDTWIHDASRTGKAKISYGASPSVAYLVSMIGNNYAVTSLALGIKELQELNAQIDAAISHLRQQGCVA